MSTTPTPIVDEAPLPSSQQAAELIMRRCDEIATLSSRPDGIERVYLSREHMAADKMAERWMNEAGLATWLDAAGSRCGRIEGREPGLPALVLGSHLDTVPDAGRYDGILGVLLAVETARRIAPSAAELPFALEVIAFHEEEGVRFRSTLLGSRAFAGTWSEDLWPVQDTAGTTLEQAFRDFGLDPERVGEAARRPEELAGYLEAHIEQGPYLEDAGRPLGVVSIIAGARRMEVTVTGEARHAGGTPYENRHDALVGASQAVVAIEEIGRRRGVVATVGQIAVEPGAVNVVPGVARFSLDLRAETDEARDGAWDEIEATMAEICSSRGLKLEAVQMHAAHSVVCDPQLRGAITTGVSTAAGDQDPMVIWSRAGHDAMAVADVCPVAMLFTRCHDGISHHPDESVLVADVAVALDAFEAAVWAVAAQQP